jgi:hypothetical protein
MSFDDGGILYVCDGCDDLDVKITDFALENGDSGV